MPKNIDHKIEKEVSAKSSESFVERVVLSRLKKSKEKKFLLNDEHTVDTPSKK